MADELIVSVSGLRGVVGKTLTPEVATRYALALVAELDAGPLVIARDGRATGRMFADVIRGNLLAVGRDVIDADVAATPTVGVLIRHRHAAGGLQISASHNPREYNGLKGFGGDGRVIPADVGQRVLTHFRQSSPRWAPHDALGRVAQDVDPHAAHLALLLGIVDVERIRACRFRVLLDVNHGAGGLLGRRLLDGLGCDVVTLGAEPTGRFLHAPEPTSANLAEVCVSTLRERAAVGFCQDPDADRLAVIDEAGNYLGEEYTLAVCLDHVLRDTLGPVVTNCSTSRMSEDLAVKYGAPFHRSKVGEANVVDMMIAKQAVFGGEGNGGPIDPRIGYVRDSFLGMALILDAMARRRQPVSELAAELPHYAICKTQASVPRDRLEWAMDKLAGHFSTAESSHLDGLRLDWPRKWLLVRASNTEPIVRLIAEADSMSEAEGLCDEAVQVIGPV